MPQKYSFKEGRQKNDGKTDNQLTELLISFHDGHTGFLYQENNAPRPRRAPFPQSTPSVFQRTSIMKLGFHKCLQLEISFPEVFGSGKREENRNPGFPDIVQELK